MEKIYVAVITGVFAIITTLLTFFLRSRKRSSKSLWERDKILNHRFFLDIHIIHRDILNIDLGGEGRTKMFHDIILAIFNCFIDDVKEFILTDIIVKNEDFLHKTERIILKSMSNMIEKLKILGFNKENNLEIILSKIADKSNFQQEILCSIISQIANCSLHQTPTEKFYIFLYILSQQLYHISSYAALEIKFLNGQLTGKEYQGYIL